MKKLFILLFAVLVNTQINAQCFKVVKTDGALQNLAIKTDGTLWAWGHNNLGQLGDNTTVNKSTPTQIGTDTNWKSVAVGLYHSVALKTDGTLWTWGYNLLGELGDGTSGIGTEKYVPTQIGTDTDWKYIAAGTYHTHAIKTDGSLWAWGSNIHGELGDGTIVSKYIPTKIGNATWLMVVAGTYHTVAIKSEGTLWAWGYNPEGQLGDGTLIDKNIPTQISTATNWQTVSTSNNHNAALKTDGTLWTWGQHDWGKLGDNTYLNPTIPIPPTQVGTSTDWQTVAAGGNHTIAIKKNGTLWAWGYNQNGEYGNGSFYGNSSIPIQIGTATDWSFVALGFSHSILVKTDGTLLATGSNYLNQLGDGLTASRNIPFQIGCTSLSINKSTTLNTSFNLYPNPTKEILYLQNTTNQFIDKIIITDLLGKTVLVQIDNSSQINIQQLQNGMYLLQIISEGKIFTDKFIKQ